MYGLGLVNSGSAFTCCIRCPEKASCLLRPSLYARALFGQKDVHGCLPLRSSLTCVAKNSTPQVDVTNPQPQSPEPLIECPLRVVAQNAKSGFVLLALARPSPHAGWEHFAFAFLHDFTFKGSVSPELCAFTVCLRA